MNLPALFNPGRVPTAAMRRHAPSGCYAIVHFGLNTFTDREWGYGDESPALFNPTAFDADLLVQNCLDGGLDGLILVCKHHDGFCLWPTATTAHNISRSPWRGGKGDLVREVADACHRRGLGLGFYVSPWDRNCAAYGMPEYISLYRKQLQELYTGYGDLFEVWFDGANGGDGYYGGVREKRPIDALTYYDWPATWRLVRQLQPAAAIFSDIGPDLRWGGSETGYADPEAFGSFTPHGPDGKAPAPGFVVAEEGATGHADGAFYMPAECDFPLRPGWFYHPAEEGQQKSPETLLDIYLRSVGCGQYMNIGLAPDRRGRLADGDVAALKGFKAAVDALFAHPAAPLQECRLDSEGAATLSFGGTREIRLVEMAEDLAEGERVLGYSLTALRDGEEHALLDGRAVGRRRLKRLEAPVACDGLRFRLTASSAPVPALRLACYA